MNKAFATLVTLLVISLSLYLAQDKTTKSSAKVADSTASSAEDSLEISYESQSILSSDNFPSPVIQQELSSEQMYEQGMQLKHCRNIPKTQDELATWLDETNLNNESDAYIQDVLSKHEICSQVELKNHSYIAVLMQSAELGNIQAAAEVWKISETEYSNLMSWNKLSREELISARKAFRLKKYELAQQAALLGSEQSIEQLIKGYQSYDPDTGFPSSYKALAYVDFAIAISNNNDFYRKADWFKQKLLEKTSYEDQEQASALTELLLQQAIY